MESATTAGNWSDGVTWDSEVWDRLNRHIAGVTLLRWSPSGYPIVPHVARAWEASPDLRTWTFHLRRGMRWSDGHPFTAGDLAYWFEWELNYFQRTRQSPQSGGVSYSPFGR